eukprot:gb/GFBE01050737.1/.p1 GENE.gb/GFBE01050737.1/~~gb/GFBE01050737.1/.p1  ORF type:complete len:165 (+),score=26.31 gb/GFBE01050737.1/:1-495(+)
MSAQPAKPILVFYHIPGDGDEAETPNAFPVLKPDGRVFLQDVRSKFPLPGSYHFRFKMRWGGEASQVAWMDVTNEASQVPLFDGKVVAKVTRVSWEASGSGRVPAQPGGANGHQGGAAAQVPKPPPDVLSFDDGPAMPAAGGYPAASSPQRAPRPNDDFDMLFS